MLMLFAQIDNLLKMPLLITARAFLLSLHSMI
ncbi:hypothetical protein N008_11530 [Hymenobacter sp. APR13]|nr:hypothetical protein N008_11530 [Hymenobacter sp. APR13]